MPHKYATLDLHQVEFHEPKELFRPLRDLVHLVPDHKWNTKISKLFSSSDLDPDKTRAGLCQGKIIAVGPEVTDLEPGQVVLVEQHRGGGNDWQIRRDRTFIFQRKFIVAVVEFNGT